MKLKDLIKGEEIFINYFSDPIRRSPLNIAFARVILGVYLIWKVSSIHWTNLSGWPISNLEPYSFLTLTSIFNNVHIVEIVALIGLVTFILGYRLKITATLTSFTLIYLGTLLANLGPSGNTDAFFISSYILLLFALYPRSDIFSIDGLKRISSKSLEEVNSHLTQRREQEYEMSILKWSLVIIGLIYFLSAVSKLIYNPDLSWISSVNLGRQIITTHNTFGVKSLLNIPIAQNSLFLSAGAALTILIESLLLVLILAGLTITPVVIGLTLFHLTVFLMLGPIFLDWPILYLLFVNWEALHEKLSKKQELDIIYDSNCSFCIRSLNIIKILDSQKKLNFYSLENLPSKHQSDEISKSKSSIHVYSNNTLFSGFNGFKKLLSQFLLSRPIALFMYIMPASTLSNITDVD